MPWSVTRHTHNNDRSVAENVKIAGERLRWLTLADPRRKPRRAIGRSVRERPALAYCCEVVGPDQELRLREVRRLPYVVEVEVTEAQIIDLPWRYANLLELIDDARGVRRGKPGIGAVSLMRTALYTMHFGL